MTTAVIMERVKKAVKSGDLRELTAEKFQELGVHVDQGTGAEDYSSLHWACHYGKAEV